MLTSAALRVALALSLAANGDESCLPGAWCETPVSAGTTALLLQALSDRNNYAATIHKPVCVRDVLRVRQQVVAGVNYLFDVNACPVDFADSPRALGACAGAYAGCRVAPFEIRVFSQPWTRTLRVESIAWLD